MAEIGKRLTRKEVQDIRAHVEARVDATLLQSLCDSHEIYREFAQRFIDIYSGRSVYSPLARESIGRGPPMSDTIEVQLFQLFLQIVGPVPRKV